MEYKFEQLVCLQRYLKPCFKLWGTPELEEPSRPAEHNQLFISAP